MITDLLADEYRIDIAPGRQMGQPGYRVQVSYRDPEGWRPCLNESVLPWRNLGPFRSTWQSALHFGISEAHEIHAMDDPPRPLVVWHDGVRVFDETAEATA